MGDKAMKIIYVDTNIYAQKTMQEQIPKIVPKAGLHCFNRPELALAYAKAEGCDVLMTEVEFLTEKLGGIRLAKRCRSLIRRSTSFSLPYVTSTRLRRSCPGSASEALSQSRGKLMNWRQRSDLSFRIVRWWKNEQHKEKE